MCPAEDPIAEPEGESAPTVLVVEDEVLVRLGAAEHLREAGFSVIEAANGEEARSVLMAGISVDLIFSDITMPKLDGVGLAQWVLVNQVHTPMVLTSGLAKSLRVAEAACPHVKALIQKPYAYETIVDRFRAILALRAKR